MKVQIKGCKFGNRRPVQHLCVSLVLKTMHKFGDLAMALSKCFLFN